jgi:hypothetical protein
MVARDTPTRSTGPPPRSSCSSTCASWWPSRRPPAELERSLTAGHIGSGIVGYLTVFFAIWWAWVNFTWFASAYDIDDVAYRLLTFVQIVGVLVLAAGVPRVRAAATSPPSPSATWSCVWPWWPSGCAPPTGTPRAAAALRYALGITLLQIGWVLRLLVPHSWGDITFCLLALTGDARPGLGGAGGRSTRGTRHISERYGLFTLIVLGECVAAATVAIQSASVVQFGSRPRWWGWRRRPGPGLRAVVVVLRAPGRGGPAGSRQLAFLWGYAHYAVFAPHGRCAPRWPGR